MKLEEAAAGVDRRVVYSRPHCDEERGVIMSTSPRVAFVLYDGDQHPKGTDPADLTFEADPEPIVVDVAPQVVDLVAALRATVEAAKDRRLAAAARARGEES